MKTLIRVFYIFIISSPTLMFAAYEVLPELKGQGYLGVVTGAITGFAMLWFERDPRTMTGYTLKTLYLVLFTAAFVLFACRIMIGRVEMPWYFALVAVSAVVSMIISDFIIGRFPKQEEEKPSN